MYDGLQVKVRFRSSYDCYATPHKSQIYVMKAGIASNVVVGLLLIAFTLPSFYAIGLWLGTNITLSTSTAETLRSGNKKAKANFNFNNNDNDQTITDHSLSTSEEWVPATLILFGVPKEFYIIWKA